MQSKYARIAYYIFEKYAKIAYLPTTSVIHAHAAEHRKSKFLLKERLVKTNVSLLVDTPKIERLTVETTDYGVKKSDETGIVEITREFRAESPAKYSFRGYGVLK